MVVSGWDGAYSGSAGTTGDYEAVSPTIPPMTSDLSNAHPRYGTVSTDDGESVGTVANPPGQNQPYRETPYTERGQTPGDDTYPTERVDKDGFPPRVM